MLHYKKICNQKRLHFEKAIENGCAFIDKKICHEWADDRYGLGERLHFSPIFETKEMEIIKQIYFEDFASLACEISDNFDMVKDEFGDIAIIAKYEEAKEIIAELVCIGHSLVSIRMSRPEWDGYCDEYIISLNHDGIWCEPMKVDGKYIPDESTMIYILDNCSSAVIPQCRGNILIEVGIADEEEFDCDGCCGCCECNNELAIESDDNMHGFTVNRSDENSYYSYSFYSTDMGLVEQMAKMFK